MTTGDRAESDARRNHDERRHSGPAEANRRRTTIRIFDDANRKRAALCRFGAGIKPHRVRRMLTAAAL
jgi:hypothetical protein